MQNFKITKYACFFTYVAMSSIFSLPPLLFVTFHEMYGISYTFLGTLLLINFCTQLIIDLIFTFFSKHFNIMLTVRTMPLITSLGLIIYALVPFLFPQKAIFGLIIGTVIFSVAAGLNEVLLSPLVAAIPSEHPEKNMSILHSLYGWGVVTVVIISSIFFKIFGTEKWMFLTFFFALLPIIASILFWLSPMPPVNLSSQESEGGKTKRSKGILLCAVCIFLGSGAENVMTNWISSFMEKSLMIPKATGDILGMAVFALLLASTRTLYAKFGKNIVKTLTVSMCGAIFCYIIAGCSTNVFIAFFACILTGICTSMLWPGTLIMMEEIVPSPGIAAYALMAACGDLGAAFSPQVTGIIIDKVAISNFAAKLCEEYPVTAEQVGLKIGMLCTAILPILGAIWLFYIKKSTAPKAQ